MYSTATAAGPPPPAAAVATEDNKDKKDEKQPVGSKNDSKNTKRSEGVFPMVRSAPMKDLPFMVSELELMSFCYAAMGHADGVRMVQRAHSKSVLEVDSSDFAKELSAAASKLRWGPVPTDTTVFNQSKTGQNVVLLGRQNAEHEVATIEVSCSPDKIVERVADAAKTYPNASVLHLEFSSGTNAKKVKSIEIDLAPFKNVRAVIFVNRCKSHSVGIRFPPKMAGLVLLGERYTCGITVETFTKLPVDIHLAMNVWNAAEACEAMDAIPSSIGYLWLIRSAPVDDYQPFLQSVVTSRRVRGLRSTSVIVNHGSENSLQDRWTDMKYVKPLTDAAVLDKDKSLCTVKLEELDLMDDRNASVGMCISKTYCYIDWSALKRFASDIFPVPGEDATFSAYLEFVARSAPIREFDLYGERNYRSFVWELMRTLRSSDTAISIKHTSWRSRNSTGKDADFVSGLKSYIGGKNFANAKEWIAGLTDTNSLYCLMRVYERIGVSTRLSVLDRELISDIASVEELLAKYCENNDASVYASLHSRLTTMLQRQELCDLFEITSEGPHEHWDGLRKVPMSFIAIKCKKNMAQLTVYYGKADGIDS